MGCVPGISADVVNVADPETSVTGAPRLLAPSLNCTVPLAAASDGVTVAVKVTACPGFAGLRDDVTVVVEASLFTTISAVTCAPPSPGSAAEVAAWIVM